MVNAALYDQRYITLPMLNPMTQCKVVYANFIESPTLYIDETEQRLTISFIRKHIAFFLS